MCNHIYISELNQEEKCQLNSRFGNEILPLDEEGKCIFHSHNVDWKKEHHFTHWLKKLNDTFGVNERNDLREFYFVSTSGKTVIDYISHLENANLDRSVFHDEVFVENNNNIVGSLEFFHCVFQKGISFAHCTFTSTVKFINPIFSVDKDKKVYDFVFENCTFKLYFTLKQCENLPAHIAFQTCTFREEFLCYDFKASKGSSFEFLNCISEKNVEFREVGLLDWIDFSKTTFDHATFRNCLFDGETFFNQIKVVNNLNFLGNEDYTIFNGITSFDIDFNNFKGDIYFQNANISNILKSHKDILLETEKHTDGRVKIGSGCIKYRRISPDYTFDMKQQHQHFIVSLGGSFSNYFTQYNGFNLGVEVRSKTAKEITLFYYTDEDVEEELFISILEQTSEKVFSIFQPDHKINEDNDTEYNLYLDVLNNFLKASKQMKLGNWDINNSKEILRPLFISNNVKIDGASVQKQLQNVNPISHANEIKSKIGSTIENHGNKCIIIANLEINLPKNQK